LRLTVEYDGTDFNGFQWQPAPRTVAGVLETALATLFEQRVKLTSAGRTDSGVHASGQVVGFSSEHFFPVERLCVALNALLPHDCSIREAATVGSDFNARFSARERTYVYAALNRPQPSALLARYAGHVARPLDLAAMRSAGVHLVGEHDFRAFGTSETAGSTVRTITRLSVEPRGELIRIEIAANAFLHHMVRIIVGTLLECGQGRRRPEAVAAILRAGDRATGGWTAPAQGLCLAGVRYEDGYDSFAEHPLFRWGAAALLDGDRAFP
jgi:tRNA pseudouridine38-40 synthase